MAVVIKIHGLVNGSRTAFDDQYVVEYNPNMDGIEPGTYRAMTAHLKTTSQIDKARKFKHLLDAMHFARRVDPREPIQDGRPNRPLTAFTLEFIHV